MSQRHRKANRAKEDGHGWSNALPNIYPGGNAGVGAYQKPGKGHGTRQSGGKAGYETPGPEKTINWPGAK